MKYLITGKNGQLAQAFIRRFQERSIVYEAFDEIQFDITNYKKADELVHAARPAVIINCAAYNFVDKAEREPEKASAVNAEGPKILATVARKYHAVLVHFSSDYVFDGSKENGLYTEKDRVGPLNAYGTSKLFGEELIRKETDAYLCFRLSWVFGEGIQNFMHKLLEWSRSKEYVTIACDEFSVPTYTHTVVDITLRALDRGLRGLYHLTNTGFCSRYEWAKFVYACLGISRFIRPVSMEAFRLPAKRPHFSAMDNRRLSGELGISIPAWDDAVSMFIANRSAEV